ncbi:MAG: hypothetical protein JKY04_03510, partial [Sneathiella sp.]|nr:hypothetical protein [Sneathiella sp.]
MIPNISDQPNALSTLIKVVEISAFEDWLSEQNDLVRNWISVQAFTPSNGAHITIPNADGGMSFVLLVLTEFSWNTWSLASLPDSLPEGLYSLDVDLDEKQASDVAIGWSLACYTFDKYKKNDKKFATLVLPENADKAHVERSVYATNLARDLINIPTSDMGPKAL